MHRLLFKLSAALLLDLCTTTWLSAQLTSKVNGVVTETGDEDSPLNASVLVKGISPAIVTVTDGANSSMSCASSCKTSRTVRMSVSTP